LVKKFLNDFFFLFFPYLAASTSSTTSELSSLSASMPASTLAGQIQQKTRRSATGWPRRQFPLSESELESMRQVDRELLGRDKA
jgi:hypothetical protein